MRSGERGLSIFSPRYKNHNIGDLWVRRCGRVASLCAQGWKIRCALGRSGVTRQKREGDGATPLGVFKILFWRIRPEFRGRRPSAPWRLTRHNDGWCDDAAHPAYNLPIRLPFGASAETMWRGDDKYHAVGVLDYNLRSRAKGAGSAIFFHICDSDFGPTAGCVAIPAREMRKLAPRLARRTRIRIV